MENNKFQLKLSFILYLQYKQVEIQEGEQMQVSQQQIQAVILKNFVDEKWNSIKSGQINLYDMPLEDLKKFLSGIVVYYSQYNKLIQLVQSLIKKRKQKQEKEQKEMLQKKKQEPKKNQRKEKKRNYIRKINIQQYRSKNWWLAIAIIFLFLAAIVTSAYSISQIEDSNIANSLKYLFIAIVLGIVLIAICKQVQPRRDIREFQNLYTENGEEA